MNYTIYMFHAIGDVSASDWADIHYSFSFEKFVDFLSEVKKVSSIKDQIENKYQCDILITFDDGHISNYQAAKYLYDNKIGTADFFINPDLVGDEFYMSWDQIRELDSMGMSIQSHGLDHQYLSDCNDEELHRQLLESKRIIEKNISSEVTILAPPGGRYDVRTVDVSKKVGYQCIANSEPGTTSDISQYLLPRSAVMLSHSVSDLLKMRSALSLSVIKQKIKYKILKLAKMLLGNTRYEKIRISILGSK